MPARLGHANHARRDAAILIGSAGVTARSYQHALDQRSSDPIDCCNMTVPRTHLVFLALAIVFSPFAYWLLTTLWSLTAIFHAELIQRLLMGLGDVREPTLWERLRAGIVWIPVSLAVALLVSLYGYAAVVFLRVLRSRSQGKA